MIKIVNKKSGISLIETIVSILILTMALLAGVQLMISIVTQTAKNKTRLQAIYLTQECLELARNARDTAWRKYQPWDCAFHENGLYKIWAEPSKVVGCENQDFPISLEKTSDSTQADFSLYTINEAQNLISHLEGEPTQFQRQMLVENFPTDAGDDDSLGKKITCRTYWIRNNKEKEVQISEVLTNWKK